MKKLIIKMCAFMILITLFTGCHQQNKLYSFETKKIDDQVILILKNTSNKPIDLSLKDQKIKCLPVNKETAFIFKKEEFKDTYYDEIKAKESTQYQEYNNFDIDRITDISLQQLNECIKKTKNDKKRIKKGLPPYRDVEFNIACENVIEDILKEQIEHSKSNPNNNQHF